MNALVRVDGHPRRVADLGLPRAAGRRRPARDRPRALRGPRPRGQRADVGQPAARHRPAHRRRQRLPALVGAVRPRGRGRLRRAGRDRRGRRRGREGPARSGRADRRTPARRPATSRPIAATCRAGTSGTRRRTTAAPSAPSRRPSASIPTHAPSWIGLAESHGARGALQRDPRARGLRGRATRRSRPRSRCRESRPTVSTARASSPSSNDDGRPWRPPGAERSSCSPPTSRPWARSG